MAERYEVIVKVISQKGICHAEQKIGDEWVIGTTTPKGICFAAFCAMSHSLNVLMFGGAYPSDADPDVHEVTCRDVNNPVVYELRRLRR